MHQTLILGRADACMGAVILISRLPLPSCAKNSKTRAVFERSRVHARAMRLAFDRDVEGMNVMETIPYIRVSHLVRRRRTRAVSELNDRIASHRNASHSRARTGSQNSAESP